MPHQGQLDSMRVFCWCDILISEPTEVIFKPTVSAVGLMYVQVHLNKLECREKFIFSCNLYIILYILDSLHVK